MNARFRLAKLESASRTWSSTVAAAHHRGNARGEKSGSCLELRCILTGHLMIHHRRTVVAHGRLAAREHRLRAARGRGHGLQIMAFEHLAARMAGGMCRPVDDEELRRVVKQVLPATDLGELDAIKDLPGMVSASVDTLRKAWRADINLQERAGDHPRIRAVAQLEAAVLEALPSTMKRPGDLAAAAIERLEHAPAILGPIDIVGITELSPCWRSLLHCLASRVPVRWIAGPRTVPPWLNRKVVEVVEAEPQAPEVVAVRAATAFHEAIEALRWARELVSSGAATPAEIAIASVWPAEYDDHLLALRRDANLNLHFVHGVKATASREGQAAAALADALLQGLSQSRVRRLNALLAVYPGPFQALPAGWIRVLPSDAPLSSLEAWERLLNRLGPADWPDGNDHGPKLLDIVAMLARGIEEAEETGEALLHGRALAIWRTALRNGPAASLDFTLETLRQEDGSEPCTSIAWMPAGVLAACPRSYVRLLGLNSSRWPRVLSEDRILSDHIIPTSELDPLPVNTADRRDFQTILATASRQVVLSQARRDGEGRLLGRSSLLEGQPSPAYLPRNAVPLHAFSETDRLMARPQEFQAIRQAASARRCWRNWSSEELTPHDGLIRAGHPVLQSSLARTQSASSLTQLPRNPLGFVWRYALRWRAPEIGEEPVMLEPQELGELVHGILDRALRRVETHGGLSAASPEQIENAVAEGAAEIAMQWEIERAVPPPIIWRRTLETACEMSRCGLLARDGALGEATAYGEVAFGGGSSRPEGAAPWDPGRIVEIPDTGFQIHGRIDRLDISADGNRAHVRDYKTGKPPKDPFVLDGGRELQRCLYAFAVQVMLGEELAIDASLHYLRDDQRLALDHPRATLHEAAAYLRDARASLISGAAVPGPDTGGSYDDLAFALPANAAAAYRVRKEAAATARLGAAARIWEAP